jgi:hypothetical protein
MPPAAVNDSIPPLPEVTAWHGYRETAICSTRLIETYRDAMASVQVLRIFLSSPGDVVEERQCAREAIAELQREPQFEHVKLEAVSWDDPQGRTPLPAQLDPQTGVARDLTKPSACDAVVGIVWARMGSPLPAGTYQKTDGSPYLSGTEHELADAFAASPGPDVLLYRRSEDPVGAAATPSCRTSRSSLRAWTLTSRP